MTLKFTKNGLDLINISSVTSYGNEWPRLIWPPCTYCKLDLTDRPTPPLVVKEEEYRCLSAVDDDNAGS